MSGKFHDSRPSSGKNPKCFCQHPEYLIVNQQARAQQDFTLMLHPGSKFGTVSEKAKKKQRLMQRTKPSGSFRHRPGKKQFDDSRIF